MRASIKIIYECMEVKKIEMESTLDNLSRVRDTAKVNLYGLMAKSLRVNGKMVKRMVMVYGDLPKEIITKVSGSKIGRMAKDITFIKEGPNIMATSKIS